jgi:hypothetical protein
MQEDGDGDADEKDEQDDERGDQALNDTASDAPRVSVYGARSMNTELNALEARVIGCLIEKQITTPDQYPLSLNALVNACNQKSNRDPVLALTEAEVKWTIDALSRKHLVIERSGFGSRVPKYQQNFCNTEYGSLKVTPQELAIVCELMLRGPQTPGELRARASRMAPFAEAGEVDQALEALASRPSGPLVVRLPRQSGRREARFAHLLSGDIDTAALASPDDAAAPAESVRERLDRLEEAVRALRAEVDELKRPGGVPSAPD